jgi:chaperonin GroES
MIRPLNNRILVLPDVPTTESRGGILKPDISQERPVEGTVIDVGKDVKDRTVTAGAVVMYGKFSGSEIVLDDVEFVMLQEDEVMGVEYEASYTIEELVEDIRDRRKLQGVALRTEPDELEEVELVPGVPEKEPKECPYCFRKVTSDHECPKKAFELIAYDSIDVTSTEPL